MPSCCRSRGTVKCVGKYSRSFSCLTLIYRPISTALIPDLQQPVFRIVPLFTIRTLQVSAPGGPLTIIILGDGEGSPAAAGNQEHLYRLGISLGHLFISGVYNLAPSDCHPERNSCVRLRTRDEVEGPLRAHEQLLDRFAITNGTNLGVRGTDRGPSSS